MKKDAIKLKLIGYLQKNIVMSEGSKLLEQFEMEAKKEVFDDLKCPEANECETIEDAWNKLVEHIEEVKKRHLSTSEKEKESEGD